MPRSTIQELQTMPDVETRLRASANRKGGAVKLGSTTSHYVYADTNQVRLKTQGAGLIMNKDQTVMQPGAALSFQVPYQFVDFNKMFFHPAADIPSTAVFPHPTLTQSFFDPTIKLVNGVYSALKALT